MRIASVRRRHLRSLVGVISLRYAVPVLADFLALELVIDTVNLGVVSLIVLGIVTLICLGIVSLICLVGFVCFGDAVAILADFFALELVLNTVVLDCRALHLVSFGSW
ncbi:MAG: hypothetical protein R2770_18780 [Acidimicrobiales bacterium]